MTSTPELEPVRFSRLKRMALSAAHFKANATTETGSMRKGTGLHSFLLGGAERVVVFEDGVRNKKSSKWIDFQAANDGKHILIPSEFRSVEGMRRSVERHPRAMALLDGVQENRITWDLLGRACAGTPDVVHPKLGRKIGVELKSSVTSHPERFNWQARKMFYHCQCAWYKDGLERTLAYEPGAVDEFYVIAVESSPPYAVTVFDYGPEDLALGSRQNRLWLEQLLVCERTKRFPAYVDEGTVVRLSVMDESGDGLEWAEDGEVAAE